MSFLGLFLLFSYTYFRLIFSFVYMTETWNESSNVTNYLRTSYYKTRPSHVFGFFILMMALYSPIVLIIDSYQRSVEMQTQDISNYVYYSEQEWFEESTELFVLEEQYWEIDKNTLIQTVNTNDTKLLLLGLFWFLFLYWIYEMLLYSFYSNTLQPLTHTKKSKLRKILNILKKWGSNENV